MKRVIAIFLTILYFSFLSGSLWPDFHPDITDTNFYAYSDETKTTQNSTEDDELDAVKYIVQSRHIASVIKIKIPRANVIASIKNSLPLVGYYKLCPSNIVNTSPCCNTSLIIKNRVFRI